MERVIRASDGADAAWGERPDVSHRELLAELMLQSYRGTVDDEGEDLGDALAVIDSLFAAEFGELLPGPSSVTKAGDRLLAATLVTLHGGIPLLAFSMTAPLAQRRGLARDGLRHAYGELCRAGYRQIRLVVTDGNVPAQALYAEEGFVPVKLPGG